MRYRDIPQFTRYGGYAVDVPFDLMEDHVQRYQTEYGLEPCPDFQRGHVCRNKIAGNDLTSASLVAD